jgi:hypothetical protein
METLMPRCEYVPTHTGYCNANTLSLSRQEGESAEPFQSPFILQTFTYHLRQVIHAAKDYDGTGNPIGALGLCAPAVSCLSC